MRYTSGLLIATLLAGGTAVAQSSTVDGVTDQAPCTAIDFESLPDGAPKDGLEISNQFAQGSGVRFRLESGGSPRLAAVGAPTTAFEGPKNAGDTPAAGQNVGRFFLTDNGSLSKGAVAPLIVSYEPPTAAASGVILDIDFGESFAIEALGPTGAVLQTTTLRAGDPGTGDGVATRWSIARGSADIHSIRFTGRARANNRFGLGFDNFCSRSSASGSLLQLSLDASVLFDFDKATLKPAASKSLSVAAQRLTKFPAGRVLIEGHTDNVGEAAYNQRLSEQRALAVQKELQSLTGSAQLKFESVGFGDTRPAADNATDLGRAANRRVEIRVVAPSGN